jgi:hypothetical protein
VVGVVGVVGVPVRRASTKLSAADGGWGMGDGIMDGSDDQSIQTWAVAVLYRRTAVTRRYGTVRYSPVQYSVKNRECEHSLVLHGIAAC